MDGTVFNLVGGRYIVMNGEATHFVQKQNYAGRLLDKIREIEAVQGADYALQVLNHMENNSMKFEIRKINNLDQLRAKNMIEEEKRKSGRGTKFYCQECKTTFYDLSKPDHSCPGCNKSKNECTRIG